MYCESNGKVNGDNGNAASEQSYFFHISTFANVPITVVHFWDNEKRKSEN